MQTEQQNPDTTTLDQMSALEIARTMNREDARVAEAVAQALPQIAQAIDVVADRLRQGGRLFYVGAGTSGRLGVLDAAECVPTFGVPREMVQGIIAGGERAMTHSIEGAEDDREAAVADLQAVSLSAQDAVVGVAASGTTPYTVAAVRHAASIGAAAIGVACNAGVPLLEAAEIGIAAVVGPEVLTGSTRLKAGTAQKMVLNMISTGAMVLLGKVYGNLMVDVQVSNQKLAARALRIIRRIVSVDEAQAQALLEAADQDVKVAIMMGRLGIGAEAARTALVKAGGHLRRALEQGADG